MTDALGLTRKEHATFRREVLRTESQRKLRARCQGMFRHQVERAVKLNIAKPDYEAEDLIAMAQAALGTACRYCQKKITVGNLSFDHERPLDRGGLMTKDNLAVIDDSCNNKKGALTAGEFQSILVFLQSFDQVARGDVLARLGVGGRWKH